MGRSQGDETATDARKRCPWAGSAPHMVAYHDDEWGVPERDERRLFEFVILEGAQAGLSWATILGRRDGYRRALHGFDAERIARYGARDIARLLADPGIIRNRLKVAATIVNARCFLDVQQEQGSFATYLWGFVDGAPVRNRFTSATQVPAFTAQSDAMSRDLKKRGFKFVGTTICYALMQAVGMVNDHLVECFRHREIDRAAAGSRPRARPRETGRRS